MNKLIISIVTLISLSLATQQMDDILLYKDMELGVACGWGHPSPLQEYFRNNNIKSPFKESHTANYRGHIATWIIKESKLYLKELKVDDFESEKQYHPNEFNIGTINSEGLVFASWFNGVIEAKEYKKGRHGAFKSTFYFQIRNGKVIESQQLTEDDTDRIKSSDSKDSLPPELQAKLALRNMSSRYIRYHYRMHANDTIILGDQGGRFFGVSPIMDLYSHDDMKWPYNWENTDLSGAPYCTWEVQNDSMFLLRLDLYSCTGFYDSEKDSTDLKAILPERIKDDKIFGDWVNGEFEIFHGEFEKRERVFESGYNTTGITLLTVENGIITGKLSVTDDSKKRSKPKSYMKERQEKQKSIDKMKNKLKELKEKRDSLNGATSKS